MFEARIIISATAPGKHFLAYWTTDLISGQYRLYSSELSFPCDDGGALDGAGVWPRYLAFVCALLAATDGGEGGPFDEDQRSLISQSN